MADKDLEKEKESKFQINEQLEEKVIDPGNEHNHLNDKPENQDPPNKDDDKKA